MEIRTLSQTDPAMPAISLLSANECATSRALDVVHRGSAAGLSNWPREARLPRRPWLATARDKRVIQARPLMLSGMGDG